MSVRAICTEDCCVTVDSKYIGYARETALCVDLAYVAMEEDVLAELDRSDGEDRAALARILTRLRERRAALRQFDQLANASR